MPHGAAVLDHYFADGSTIIRSCHLAMDRAFLDLRQPWSPDMATIRPGIAALAAAMIALGILGLGTGDFALVWQPVPAWVPLRAALAYAFAAVSLAAGLGILWRRTAAPSAAIALGYFFLWWLLLR